MISIDDHPPPDPSSSHHNRHHQQQIAHDLNVSDIDLKSPDVDLHDTCNNQLPNFSIRDYVFGLRSKDVACNWPFSPTSLQLCLKHGVKNLLPPFQSLENRSHDEEETLISFHGKPRNDRRKSNAEQASGSVTVTVSTNSSGFKRDNESQFQFQQHVAHTRSKETIKKSKLVMKLNQGVEQVEEISMASKICPVCKVFSSSSNTTLNAHIDQCLTGDQGTMKWTDNPKAVVKHRVKPRKTRLMVEIYKTAPHCTIEELDRRNGTNWATNSSFPAQEFQFDHGDEEEEKEEARTITTVNRDVADNEGDVYIDTDGTKVRILSVPKSGSLDDNNNLGDRKLLKGVKGSKFVMGKKKFKRDLHKQKHHKKFLKLIPNARKLCSLKSQARNEEDDANCSKDERPRNRLADLAIVRPPWACSKRTNLAKRKHRKNLRIIESDKSSSRCDLGSPPLSSDEVAVSQSRKKTKTLPPLMAEFRKESSRMHDDDDDNGVSSDSSPSENSDHSFETRSKVGGKLLRKNLSLKTKSSSHSSKENSRNEEHVRKNDEITRSVTSKSSNEEESSIGVETADVDALHDLESVRNDQTIPNLDHDQVCVLQPPPNFTGLSNSFDPDFSKCVELYQEQLLSCSTNRAPEVEKHDFFFHEEDPIPIPGPPGSFLPPSPGGDMVSDEQQLQANSSSTTTTTTTRIPSTETHHNHDRDSMSNSPVSTVSNPSNLARSESRSTSVVQEDHTKPGFLVNGMHTKSLTSFKNDPQPCCCSRKDAAFSYNIQESSTNVRRQSIESNKSSTPIGFNFRSDTFPLSNYSISQAPETAIFPTMKKPPDYGGSDSTTTPSKPVLRLMGKNLTVVKTDENIQPFRPPQPPPVIFNGFQNGTNVYPPVSHGGFMDRYGHGGGYMGHTVPQARAHHDHNSREIIIIDNDELPINELDDSMRSENLRRNRGQMNPLYTMYQAQSSGHHMYSGGGGVGGGGGSTVVRGGSFNGDLGKWDVGLGAASPSRSMSHMRSSTSYYPPSYP